jgi:hypothetical protein
MKRALCFLLFFVLFCVNAQEVNDVQKGEQEKPRKNMASVPIHPKCENRLNNGNLTCLYEIIKTKLQSNPSFQKEVDEFLNQSNRKIFDLNIQYIMNSEGEMEKFKILKSSGNPELDAICLKAMEEVSLEMEPVIPAKFEDGTPANINMTFPISIMSF